MKSIDKPTETICSLQAFAETSAAFRASRLTEPLLVVACAGVYASTMQPVPLDEDWTGVADVVLPWDNVTLADIDWTSITFRQFAQDECFTDPKFASRDPPTYTKMPTAIAVIELKATCTSAWTIDGKPAACSGAVTVPMVVFTLDRTLVRPPLPNQAQYAAALSSLDGSHTVLWQRCHCSCL